MPRCCLAIAVLSLVLGLSLRSAAEVPADRKDLAQLSLEQLMDIEVVTVSKRDQKLAEASVAVYVITQEDIRRSGTTSLAEALRMVPGVSVARIDSNKWAVSSRGFLNRFANKLLVLVDGRSVYTPTFSGTHWDIQDMLLEDVERIEVIRGPGATLWGANAVTGVINVITKRARDTQGGLLLGGIGSHEPGLVGARYGAPLGKSSHFRAYAKYFDRGSFEDEAGRDWGDDWNVVRGGFRLDREGGPKAALTFQGDLYDGRAAGKEPFSFLTPPHSRIVDEEADFSGGNILGRWEPTLSLGSEGSLQAYYDRTTRRDAIHGEARDTFDVDWQHRVSWGTRRQVVWGLGYRRTSDHLTGTSALGFADPARRTDHLLSGFLQGELVLRPDRLRLIAGSKFERNDYSGFEVQPNLRLLWTPSGRTSAWAALSRAVRTPSRFEHAIRESRLDVSPGPGGLLVLTMLTGDRGYDAEDLLAWEAGYRTAPSPRLFLDLAVFYDVHKRLQTLEPGVPFLELRSGPPHLVVPVRFANLAHGEAYGAEAAATWSPATRWKLNLAYSFLRLQLHRSPGSADPVAERPEGSSPRHQFHLRSYLDVTSKLALDGVLYRVSRLPGERVPAYTRLDLRVAWRATPSLEVSGLGQDVTAQRHQESWLGLATAPARIPRRISMRAAWRF